MRKTFALLLVFALFVAAVPAVAQEEEIYCPEGAEGTEVSILSVWGGDSEADFLAVLAPVADACGLTINHEGTRDLGAVLETRVAGGNPPDVSIIPNPGVLPRYADKLVDLAEVGADAEAYNQSWIDMGTVDDKWVGLFVKSDIKDVVWYSPAEFEANGYEVPATWEAYLALIDQMVADGFVPFSMGMESGEATGWTGTDTIQGILLTLQGLDVANGLVTGETAWNDPVVAEAWELFGSWATDEAYALGGADGTLNTGFNDAIFAVFADPPEAMMVRQSGFGGGSVASQYPDLVYGEDYAFFVVPGLEEGEPAPMQIGGDVMSVFNATPAAEAIIAYLTSAAGAEAWAASGFDLSPNMYATADVYEDPIFADKAEALLAAPAVSFDVGDLLPGGMGMDEFENLAAYVNGTVTIEEALDALQVRFEEVMAK